MTDISRRSEAGQERGSSLKEDVETELDRLGQGGRWVWSLFLIGTLPNILNGYHVSSYVFVGRMPDEYWCDVPALRNASWSKDNIITLSTMSDKASACDILDYDYAFLSTLSFEQAIEHTRGKPTPGTRSCLHSSDTKMRYELEGTSIVPEWDLVCENSVWRTVVQMIISLGKCIGACSVGIASDRFGRRNLFAYGAILFTFASLITTFSPWYWAFLVGRFLLGSSSSGIFYPAVIMMTENVASKHRGWIGVAFNIAYPIGMLYLAFTAYYLTTWRSLQIALTVPVIVLPLFWYLFKESPRWLLSKGHTEQAYRVVFKKPAENVAFLNHADSSADDPHATTKSEIAAERPSGGMFREIRGLYSSARSARIAVICHFAFFTASFSYYVTALNAVNLSSNKVIYVSATGAIDICAYLGGILMISFVGRKWCCFWSFCLAGVCMLAILIVPGGAGTGAVVLSMVGRLGVSCVYAIVTFYTGELFPTEVRNSAVGISSMFGHMGSMMAPFVVDFLGLVAWYIPTTIAGCALFVAALLVLLNPETQQARLVDHVRHQGNVNEGCVISSDEYGGKKVCE